MECVKCKKTVTKEDVTCIPKSENTFNGGGMALFLWLTSGNAPRYSDLVRVYCRVCGRPYMAYNVIFLAVVVVLSIVMPLEYNLSIGHAFAVYMIASLVMLKRILLYIKGRKLLRAEISGLRDTSGAE